MYTCICSTEFKVMNMEQLLLFIFLSRLAKCHIAFLSSEAAILLSNGQVCDFGLSRLKANTFLSSKSTAGTVSFLSFL